MAILKRLQELHLLWAAYCQWQTPPLDLRFALFKTSDGKTLCYITDFVSGRDFCLVTTIVEFALTHPFFCLYADLVFLLGLFIFYQTASKSTFVQNIVVGVLAFGLFSFWVPQIYRNVIRGSRRALSHRYVIGMSLTRLVVPLCKLYVCKFKA